MLFNNNNILFNENITSKWCGFNYEAKVQIKYTINKIGYYVIRIIKYGRLPIEFFYPNENDIIECNFKSLIDI